MAKVMRNQVGVSLIEVLVAMLILGIGVMGYAAVQLNAVKLTEDTYSRSQAMAIAQDAIERLRANVGMSDQYIGEDQWADVGAWVSCVDREAPCGEADMVTSDITQLNHMATNMLPNGSMVIDTCSIDVENGALCVTVAWSTTVANDCDQTGIANGETADNAHCVVVEFIP